jgi:hypothetical protein
LISTPALAYRAAMPHGFFTIERGARPPRSRKSQWVAVRDLDGFSSLSDAEKLLERLNQPGLYRVVQTQRMIWAEKASSKLRLRKWHAITPESLARTAAAFDRDGGKWPVKPKQGKKV